MDAFLFHYEFGGGGSHVYKNNQGVVKMQSQGPHTINYIFIAQR